MTRATAPLLLSLFTTAAAAAQEGRLTPRLDAVFRDRPAGEAQLVWVFFRDKGPAPETSVAQAFGRLAPRALSRRVLRGRPGPLVRSEDLPVVPAYLEAVARGVTRVRHVSRWFNAVSAEATADQARRLAALPFVERVDLVRRSRARPEPTTSATPAEGPYDLAYGSSLGQVQQINVPAVHALGFSGAGVLVAVFDSGFDNLGHQAFSRMTIVARRDFVNGDDDVGNGLDRGDGSHGTATLSVLGGLHEGELIGPAYGASFLLAKTEDTESETPVEEDNWAAAAEWAEAMGADVISSSLGYLGFDSPFTGYTYLDMDGETAISTRAADLAASLGVVVVISAGNAGFHPDHNTLGAPADGNQVIAAGAVTSLGTRASFSSVGPTVDGRIKPDVAAQGVAVKAASSFSPTAYRSVSGTSFSCPLTAGVVALILQAHPTYTVDQVHAVLRGTARNAASPDNLLGWGIVDALAAVLAPEPTIPAPDQ
jgi:subtilisin family serine protease